MRDRILDIAETAASLHVRHGALEVRVNDQTAGSLIPFEEIAAVVAAHPQFHCTRAVLSGLCGAGAVLVVCDDSHMPTGMMLPLVAHHLTTERLAAQVNASKPTRKRIWQDLVRAKIRHQAAVLQELRGDDFGLSPLIAKVRSGDPDNVEARAARIYWPALFDDPSFLRRRDRDDQNRMLNYGYAALRAMVARAVCASGLHPAIGVHHHNRYNPFCLADDIMEPFRPLVDRTVVEITEDLGGDAALDGVVKQRLLEPLVGRYMFDGENRQFSEILAATNMSLVNVLSGEAKAVSLPDLWRR